MKKMLKIQVVAGKCIGAGNCVDVAEEFFDQNDDDAKVIVLKPDVPDHKRAAVERAVSVCPVAALRLIQQ